ncbi:MAG TPA: T9SS type A sorting domain-containing protein, partial [Flavobacterium alvei]|nr:T9SS type A sorting domain-containing protein [Flavobacterium alvei]
NIFYAVKSKVFAVGYSVTSECNTYNFTTPVAIPDGPATYTTRTINVPASSASIVDVNVGIGIQHAFMSDVEIEIVSPEATTVVIQKSSCGTNLNINYDDSGNAISCTSTTLQNVIPKQSLSAFNGQNPSNTWTLRFRDASSGGSGTLNTASITICTKTYVALGTNDLYLTNFEMYPNPSKGQFNIQFSSQSKNDIKVLVHDLLGRKVFENKYKNNSSFNEDIQLKNVTSGIYLLTVVDGDRKEERKIIIE